MHTKTKELALIPDSFEDLEEARSALDMATNGLFRVFYIWSKPRKVQPPEAYATYKTYSAQLLAWDSSFSASMSLKSHALTTLQIRGAALLKIHHTTATIIGRCVPDLTDPRSIIAAANDPSFLSEHQRLPNRGQSLAIAGRSRGAGYPAETAGNSYMVWNFR
ncbi:hypothetical protein VC83_02809 [Pseudogymnoascus destructans]|uniref:Uncharacterized protein n=1 Tax=Pseudogymnoascus destructans TaxID=655981 RepID=A0A177ADW7_9PEZI|nr:uncharacterized protein VC83_02809 [Pseudogymnoascus destructans]OAF60306.1 hypothetical protein VC83_02809 [Pseudogymnoascus destructans]